MSAVENDSAVVPNGAALAAFLAAGIGAFAMGLIALLDAVGVLPVPALYEPAGGVTGRTTLAVLVWIIAWVVLHSRWKNREMEPRRIHAAVLALILVGILLAWPPVWAMAG